MHKRSRNVSIKNEEVAGEIEELKKRREDMSAAIDRMESGVGIEEELREKFQITKPGEEYVVIIDNNGQEENSSQKNGPAESEKSFFEVFLDFFKIF